MEFEPQTSAVPNGALPRATRLFSSGTMVGQTFSLLTAHFHLHNKPSATTHNSKNRAQCKLEISVTTTHRRGIETWRLQFIFLFSTGRYCFPICGEPNFP